MPPDDGLGQFSRLIRALRPFLRDLVIVGGWAHRLHRFHADAVVPSHLPLFTEDADIAIPSNAGISEALRERLLAKTADTERGLARQIFDDITDTVRRAARIATGRELTPDPIRTVCAFGLGEKFEG